MKIRLVLKGKQKKGAIVVILDKSGLWTCLNKSRPWLGKWAPLVSGRSAPRVSGSAVAAGPPTCGLSDGGGSLSAFRSARGGGMAGAAC